MQLNKAWKCLVVTLPIIILSGCSTNKDATSNNRYDNIEDTINSETDVDSSRSSSMPIEVRGELEEREKNIVYFDLNKYNIRPDFTSILDSHANFLRGQPSYKVIIEGHADERGTPEYNIALGERRANAVKMYLQGNGVPEDQISIVSYGKEKPAELGHNEFAYSKNRRAVLVY